jgi:two-component system, OmpR family, KDP operon response regulator KdpE
MNHSWARRVLLVEDDDLNRSLARTVLGRSDHPVARHSTLVEATDLAGARTELAGAPIDLILLDMHLPDGHGLSLAQELAAAPTRPVIVALTGSVLPQERDTMRAAGCDDFLGKPYRPNQLIDVLAAHLPTTGAASYPGT